MAGKQQKLIVLLAFLSLGNGVSASASRSLLSRMVAPIKAFTSTHPRLTKTAKIAAITGGALWLLDRIINRPVHIPQGPIYFDNDQAAGPAGQVQEKEQKRETAYLFAHGLGGDCEHVNGHLDHGVVYINRYGDPCKRFWNSGNGEESQGLYSSCCAVNFPDARRNEDGTYKEAFHENLVFLRQFKRSSIGQDSDIECFKRVYDQYLTRGGKNKNIVLYGASRGASTIINFMARSRLNSVKALVLESPLDSVHNHVGEILGKWKYVPGLHWFGHHFIVPCLYRKYNPRGVQPLDVVDKIQPDVPVLFVCSKTELFYPETIRLYKKLARARHAQGQNNVHLLVLESGEHCGLLYDHHCGGLYCGVVRAFYDAYGIERNTSAAQDWVEGCVRELYYAKRARYRAVEAIPNSTPPSDCSAKWKEYNEADAQCRKREEDLERAKERRAKEPEENRLGAEFFATTSQPDPDTLPF